MSCSLNVMTVQGVGNSKTKLTYQAELHIRSMFTSHQYTQWFLYNCIVVSIPDVLLLSGTMRERRVTFSYCYRVHH